MNCWFEESVTDSFDRDRLAPLHDGLGLLSGSACPHYDGEEEPQPTLTRLGAAGGMVCAGRELVEVVTSRPDAGAYRVERTPTSDVSEVALAARYLGA